MFSKHYVKDMLTIFLRVLVRTLSTTAMMKNIVSISFT